MRWTASQEDPEVLRDACEDANMKLDGMLVERIDTGKIDCVVLELSSKCVFTHHCFVVPDR